MAAGFALGLVAVAYSAIAEKDDALVFNAILLAWIGAVYLGFAIAEGMAPGDWLHHNNRGPTRVRTCH
jgi:hypothetical protein